MKRMIWTLCVVAIACVATAIAQSPGGRRGPGAGRGGPGGAEGPGREGHPPIPVIEALDADHNGTISADELKNATTALLTLDKNKDGRLTEDEMRPLQPGRGPEGGRGGPGQGQPGRGAQGGGGARGQNGPPPGAGRGGAGSGRPTGRGPEAGGPGGEGRGPEGRDGAGGPPRHNPERFVEHAMEFDADKDGKLSQEELLKFGEEMGRRRMAEEGPDGDRPNDEGRSERPKRPE